MNYTLIREGERSLLECEADGWVLQSERDALDLVAACGENSTGNLLLPSECLSDDFFRLSTGLAGAVLLKFSLYSIRCAVLITPEQASTGRFGEMVLEANRRNRELHFFGEVETAKRWLFDEEG